MQFDFSEAFNRVNHLGILYKLCSVGIGGSILSILTQFLLRVYGRQPKFFFIIALMENCVK